MEKYKKKKKIYETSGTRKVKIDFSVIAVTLDTLHFLCVLVFSWHNAFYSFIHICSPPQYLNLSVFLQAVNK